MANVKVTWALPVARESVRPLAPADIHHVRLEISADGGANYGVFWTFGASILEATVTDLEPGEWWFRGIVVDTASRQSQPVSSSITIADTTPPGPLTLSLSLA